MLEVASPAVSCARCGVFLEAGPQQIDGKPYCQACAARPDVDYLEAFRLQYWGRRDGWAWVVGATVPFSVYGVAMLLAGEAWVQLPGALLAVVAGAAFFQGRPWARWGLPASACLNLVVGFAGTPLELLPFLVGGLVITLAVWATIIFDPRNKLFFRLPVDRQTLRRAWELYENNTVARAGFLLGLLGLIAWPLAVLSLPLSVAGLMKVDLQASPPIGRRGQAIAGIVLSALELLALGALWLSGKR